LGVRDHCQAGKDAVTTQDNFWYSLAGLILLPTAVNPNLNVARRREVELTDTERKRNAS